MEQVILMILTLLLVVVLRHIHHQIYNIISAHPVVIVVTVNGCFQKEGHIIHRQEWRGTFGNGTKVMLSSDSTERNINLVDDTIELDSMVFQS